MRFDALPVAAETILAWTWDDYSPYYEVLLARELNTETADQWLRDLSRVGSLLSEQGARLQNIYSHDTRVPEHLRQLEVFQQGVLPQLTATAQKLREKLLGSGFEPEGLHYPLRQMRADAAGFREENIGLQVQERGLINDYNRITGMMTVEFEGREVTLSELRAVQEDTDRARRESAWRIANTRFAEDRAELSELWAKLVDLRVQMTANAERPNYLEHMWPLKGRFDYSVTDAKRFQASILDAVVPVLAKRHELRKQQLGVETLRPWDLSCDPLGRHPLKPFEVAAELEETGASIFSQLDPQLGEWFESLRAGQLDLANTPGKAPGGWCSDYSSTQLPHIFMNAVGTHNDVQTLLHEAGHAFHNFSTYALPYSLQRKAYMEFCEVASMAMELIAAPYLDAERGGFYDASDSARAQVNHFDHMLYIWAMVAAGDAFQHWIYENPEQSRDAALASRKYAELWQRYFPAVDYSGVGQELAWGWQRILHFYVVPLYYIEYGLAQLGAVQVWINALEHPNRALRMYKDALELGGTASLPALFEAAGAKLSFEANDYGLAVAAMVNRIRELET
ncbi:MAG: M3 family oligoendopeptidase [bacterium]|nr:M3 family oligoendopeptidase [bacterium]